MNSQKIIAMQKIAGHDFCVCDTSKQDLITVEKRGIVCKICDLPFKGFSCGSCNKTFQLTQLTEKEGKHDAFGTTDQTKQKQVQHYKIEFFCPQGHLVTGAVVWEHEVKEIA